MFPSGEIEENSYYYDVKANPQNYLKHMIWMNVELERLELKTFQPIPLRSDIIPKYIEIDTTALLEISNIKGKGELQKNITDNKDMIWCEYFDTSYIREALPRCAGCSSANAQCGRRRDGSRGSHSFP